MDREKELKELSDTAEDLLEGINNLIEVVKGKEYKTMTKAEFEKMDFRNLTDKARKVAESSDQSLYEYVKDLNANDFAGISAVLEDIADLSEEE